MVWLVVFTEYQLHLRSEALRSCSEGQNFLFPCWNSILSFLLQMFRLTRPPEAQIRTNLRPSVASVGLFFSGDYALEYTATRSFRTWNGGTRSRKSGGTWCWWSVRHVTRIGYTVSANVNNLNILEKLEKIKIMWNMSFYVHNYFCNLQHAWIINTSSGSVCSKCDRCFCLYRDFMSTYLQIVVELA